MLRSGNEGILRKNTLESESGVFLTLGSGTFGSQNKNLRPLLNTNIPPILDIVPSGGGDNNANDIGADNDCESNNDNLRIMTTRSLFICVFVCFLLPLVTPAGNETLHICLPRKMSTA